MAWGQIGIDVSLPESGRQFLTGMAYSSPSFEQRRHAAVRLQAPHFYGF
jgi:hypothetical protein